MELVLLDKLELCGFYLAEFFCGLVTGLSKGSESV